MVGQGCLVSDRLGFDATTVLPLSYTLTGFGGVGGALLLLVGAKTDYEKGGSRCNNTNSVRGVK